MNLYVSNAFSLSMLDREMQLTDPCRARTGSGLTVRVPKPVEDVKAFLGGISMGPYVIESILGHESSRAIFERALGIWLPVNRKAIRLGPRDRLLVGQTVGEDGQPVRLPEGATELPEGVHLEWWVI